VIREVAGLAEPAADPVTAGCTGAECPVAA
jgi:hypothetical protein